MDLDSTWLKAHWYYAVGAVLGVYVLYKLLSSSTASSSTSSTDLSGGAVATQNLQAAADLQNAQVNGAIAVAQIQGNVADTQAAAALKATEVTTLAEADVANHQTSASVDIAGINAGAAENIQQTVTQGQVDQTAIEGQTLTELGAQKEAVNLAITNNVAKQIQTIQTYSKNAAKDYGAITPVLAEETGQGATVGAAKPTPGSTTAQNISAVGSGISSILSGLFGN